MFPLKKGLKRPLNGTARIRGQKSDNGGQRSENREQKSEARDQRSEVRKQRTENRKEAHLFGNMFSGFCPLSSVN
jgi:hypothetical protein